MKTVTSINLNGIAYQLEDAGFAELSTYLSQAEARLSDNPDKVEILADLEQAIADKFGRFLSPQKTVVTAEEVSTAITEMGPVDAESATVHTEGPAPTGPKRLYRIQEGEWVAGIANGVAAYLNVDVNIIRIIFVVLIFLTSGGFIFAYILGWVFIPLARTNEQEAAASGKPFTAEEVIARAKADYANLNTKGTEWKKQWRDWRKEQKREAGKYAKWNKHQYQWSGPRHHRSFLGQLIGLVVISFFVWLGYHHVPVIHDFLTAVWNLWHRVADQIAQFIVDNDEN